MKNLLSVTACCMLSVVISLASCTPKVPKGDLKTTLDSLSYASGIIYTQGLDGYLDQLGITEEYKGDFIKGLVKGANINKDDTKALAQSIGENIGLMIETQMIPDLNGKTFGSDSKETIDKDQFVAGFIASVKKEGLLVDEMMAQQLATTLSEKIKREVNMPYLIENTTFLEENKKNPDVVALPSGLQYKVLVEGKGAKPTVDDRVKVHYVGTNIKGEEFDSSIKREQPFEFTLRGGVIPGWIEAVQLMPVGSKYMFYIPYDLAYGDTGRPGAIDPYATLIFEIELLEILK